MSLRKVYCYLIAATLVTSTSCKKKMDMQFDGSADVEEAWDENSDPVILNPNYNRAFQQLPLEGNIDRVPWTDIYWPANKAGIAQRWNDTKNPDPYTYALLSKDEVLKASPDIIKSLSPAEKYDIYMGRYDYPTVRWERAANLKTSRFWEGYCHGWAPASIFFQEPKPTEVSNADGVKIPFGSSDVKALLTFYQGEREAFQLDNIQQPYKEITGESSENRDVRIHSQMDAAKERTKQLGDRCLVKEVKFKPFERLRMRNFKECNDVNAGAFHVIIANQVGLQKQGLIADLDKSAQIWNYPIYGFKSEVIRTTRPTRRAAKTAVKEHVVRTRLDLVGEVRQPSWEPLAGTETESQKKYTLFLNYRVEIDADGQIVGGRWLSRYVPDFVWIQDQAPFQGYFEGIQRVYQASLGQK